MKWNRLPAVLHMSSTVYVIRHGLLQLWLRVRMVFEEGCDAVEGREGWWWGIWLNSVRSLEVRVMVDCRLGDGWVSKIRSHLAGAKVACFLSAFQAWTLLFLYLLASPMTHNCKEHITLSLSHISTTGHDQVTAGVDLMLWQSWTVGSGLHFGRALPSACTALYCTLRSWRTRPRARRHLDDHCEFFPPPFFLSFCHSVTERAEDGHSVGRTANEISRSSQFSS